MFEGLGRGARAALSICSLLVLLCAAARAQCPQFDNIGWARGSTVRYFLDANLSAEQKRLARWALAEWSRAGSVNNARVRFEEDFTGQNFQLHLFNGSLGGNTPAFANKQFTPDGTVVSATLTYDPNAVFAGSSTLIADPAQPGYEELIIKITLHEVGHTLGLDHPPGTENPCAQPRGASVMNYICNVNDRSNNMPLRVTECDRGVLNSLPRYPAFNQSPNPIDGTQFFVRQHYLDFLNREPDAGGLNFWSQGIEQCGANTECRRAKRVDTSAAFFLSIEFQETGYFVYRVYQAAFGDLAGKPVPVTFGQMTAEAQLISQGVVVNQGDWRALLEANKAAYLNEFVARPAFAALYPASQTPAQYVDALNANTGLALSTAERNDLIARLADGRETRAGALHRIIEDADFRRAETNGAFVLMQYFGYLRRNPNDEPEENRDFAGYQFWLGNLVKFNGNFEQAELVKAFISSIEYRQRFVTP